MADQTTVGTPLESAVELAAGRMSGPIKTVAAPLTCTSELAENVVYPGGLSAVRNPEDVVTQNALCIRATAPADLGDEDAFSCEATILSANQYLPTAMCWAGSAR